MRRPPHGETLLVDDVPAAFADVVVAEQPRTMALSGGATARRCYEVLATRSGIDWAGVSVVFGDERWVPVDHPDSNEGMARTELLDHVDAGAVHSARQAGTTPAEAAAAYDRLVADLGAIDLVHLGLGADGHTASLFPRSPAVDVTDRLVVATGDETHDHERITLTLPGIARARMAVVTVSGQTKREAWRRLCDGEDLPAARVRPSRLLWLVDLAAAGP